MTKIKLCGLSRECDIEYANRLLPDYIGFVMLFEKSHRNITPERASKLKALLDKRITAVGVFVDAPVQSVALLLNDGVIDIAQLHGSEDEEYISSLRALTDKPIIKAFKATDPDELIRAEDSSADFVLLDSGKGYGISYDFDITKSVKRPYFLAGGINLDNVADAVKSVHPYCVDVSSGIETDKLKDGSKMAEFVRLVRSAE